MVIMAWISSILITQERNKQLVPIAYILVRSKRETLALHITPEGELEVRAPLKLPQHVIDDFIHRKQDWISKKIEHVKQRKTAPKLFTEGEKFLYLGQTYELSFVENQKLPVDLKDKLSVASRHKHRAKKVLTDWYKQEATLYINDRVEYYSELYKFAPKSIKINSALRRWGSCSGTGNINFAWRLIMAQVEVIDYVVVHELVHLRQHDHSRAFWSKVEQIMPDYKKRRMWLKTHGATLSL
jgi:predicted metal-dependent hydrolase